MMKKYERDVLTSCFNKAKDDEPIFVLRAQDRIAPNVIDMWCEFAECAGVGPAKIQEARHLAEQMRAWKNRRFPT